MSKKIRVLKTGRFTFDKKEPVETIQNGDTFVCPDCQADVQIKYQKDGVPEAFLPCSSCNSTWAILR